MQLSSRIAELCSYFQINEIVSPEKCIMFHTIFPKPFFSSVVWFFQTEIQNGISINIKGTKQQRKHTMHYFMKRITSIFFQI